MGIYNILISEFKVHMQNWGKFEGCQNVHNDSIIENMNLLNKILMPIKIIMKDLVCLQVYMYIDKYFQPWWCFGSLSGRCMESYIDLMKGDKLYTNDFWVDCFVYIYLKKKKILLWPGSRYLHGKKDNAVNVRRKGRPRLLDLVFYHNDKTCQITLLNDFDLFYYTETNWCS